MNIDNISANPGIYMIINQDSVDNGKYLYVGQTVNLQKRAKRHLFALNYNEFKGETNKLLYNSWNSGEYNHANFEFQIVEEVVEKYPRYILDEILTTMEQCWITKTWDYSYNLRPIADKNSGIIFTQETKQKMTDVQDKQGVKVFDCKTGKLLYEFISIQETCRELKLSTGSMYKLLDRIRLTEHGYVFRRVNEYSENHLSNDELLIIEQKSCGRKSIHQCDKNTGKILNTFDTIKQAADYLGTKGTSNISSCCKRKIKSAYGYQWRYAE